MFTDEEKHSISEWFKKLRGEIITAIEGVEAGNCKKSDAKKFQMKKWNREGGGGGEMGILYGDIFEKMGVNFSCVEGNLSDFAKNQLPGTQNSSEFWASGVSLVSHPKNPFVPPIHMNVRAISTRGKSWFGGALDLNPIYPYDTETENFHSKIKQVCDLHSPVYYECFAKECQDYFYLHHRKEHRGVGGIFFDYFDADGNLDAAFNFVQAVGNAFIPIYSKIINDKINTPYDDSHREHQLIRRGRYAEFNLLYDRGIKFGLMTGGNPDGMMMSLPPVVKWL